ncbi:MAG: chemotaxis protein CheV [Solirubrobacterales bacterium]
MAETGVLLEAGTEEMEIVEFTIGNELYGINVIKVREIIKTTKTVPLPGAHPCMEGLIELRGSVLPIINLGGYLNAGPSENPEMERIIVTEFNLMKTGFHVHSVNRIHRIKWSQVEKPAKYSYAADGIVVGIIKMDDRIILLLDFEKIVVDINPRLGFQKDSIEGLSKMDRSEKNVLIAEDSHTLQAFLKEVLHEAGYTKMQIFDNGAEAWQFLESRVEAIEDGIFNEVNLLITDIEMPQMDGHQLTRRVKEHKILKKLPVIIFSSLITEDLLHKGQSVGADDQISKPQYLMLAGAIDRLVL